MMVLRSFHVTLVVSFLILTMQKAQAKELRVVYSAVAGSQALFFVTRDAGLFKKYGLDVSFVFVQGGTTAALALLAGDVPLAAMAGISAVRLDLKGGDLVFVAGVVNSIDYAVVVAPHIKKASDLKGKKFSISRLGDFSDFAARQFLQKLGLNPDKDVAIIQFGDQPSRFAALQRGEVQGTIIDPSNLLAARKLGLGILATADQLAVPAQGTAVVTTKRSIKNATEDIRLFLKGLAEGIWYYKTFPEESRRSIAKYLGLKDPDQIEETYKFYRGLLPRVPYPTESGIDSLLRLASPGETRIKAKDLIDTRFVGELEESGFISRLYK